MELHTEYKSGSLCIRLAGELDHHTAALTFQRIESALDRYLPRSCTLEMSGLGFMDSSVFWTPRRSAPGCLSPPGSTGLCP